MTPHPPTWAPPDGSHWTLQRGVILYSGNVTPSALNLPPGYGPPYDLAGNPTHYVNFDGITSYQVGSDYTLAGAVEYAFEKWYFAQFQMYVDGAATELMAAQPDASSGSQCTTVLAGETLAFLDTRTGHTTAWPWLWQFTWHSHSHSCYSGSLAVAVLKIVGDVWTAEPGIDDYTTISGTPPTTDIPIDECPPACGQNNTAVGAGVPAAADAGLSVRWGRNEARVVWTLPLGAVGGLSWDAEWDGERALVLDGLHYTVTMLPRGGLSQQGEYRWATLPGTDASGVGLWFVLDTTALDDPAYVLR